MSRTIKEYPYSEEFGDTLYCTAESIKEFELPGAASDISKDFKENRLIVSFSAEAKEDEKGIFITASTNDNKDIPSDLRGLSITRIVDEVEFVDAIYESVINGGTMDESKVIQDILLGIMKDFVTEFVFPAGYYVKNNGSWVNCL